MVEVMFGDGGGDVRSIHFDGCDPYYQLVLLHVHLLAVSNRLIFSSILLSTY